MLKQLAYKIIDLFAYIASTDRVFNITIYMKSGNVIKLKRVTEFDYKHIGGDVTSLAWTQLGNTRLLHIDLDQIESFTQGV